MLYTRGHSGWLQISQIIEEAQQHSAEIAAGNLPDEPTGVGGKRCEMSTSQLLQETLKLGVCAYTDIVRSEVRRDRETLRP